MKGIYSEFAVSKESTSLVFGGDSEADRGEWRQKGQASGVLWLAVVGPGSWGRGTFCDWFGEHVELSLVGSDLDAATKVRKAGNHSSSPACSNLISAVCGLAV